MSWWVYLQDQTAEPWCTYTIPPEAFVPKYVGDERCQVPCYPSVSVGRHEEGGTYAVGGIDAAELNVTYNYCSHFRDALEDPTPDESDVLVRLLDGKRAADVTPLLARAVERLGTEPSGDYWEASAGNAGRALAILLGWAKEHPDAIFAVH